jgi:hypothetical protein
VRKLGGIVIRLIRPEGGKALVGHVSEQFAFAADVEIVNDGTIEDLKAKIDAAVAEHWAKTDAGYLSSAVASLGDKHARLP